MKYFCYDSALNEEYTLIQLMQRYSKHTNIFQGTDDTGIWDAAPWLFELNGNPYELKGQPLIQLDHCIVFETNELLQNVLDYLHSKIYRKENGQSIYFRIWDARVLTEYLQQSDAADIRDFFQVFAAFYTESNEDDFLNKWQWKGGSKTEAVKVLKTEALPLIKTEEELDREYEAQPQPAIVTGREPETDVAPLREKEKTENEKPKRRRFLAD